MKTLDMSFETHVKSGETTLAYCWRVERTDGLILGFTDHDVELEFDGTIFTPAQGVDAGETASKLGPQVDTSEVLGIVHSSAIDENDILLGRYDGATVETWRVNWREVTTRHLLRRDTVGEIIREDGVFRLELRSAQHGLNLPKGKIYQSLCGTSLGATPCGIDLDIAEFRAFATVVELRDRQSFTVDLLRGFATSWFDFGKARWTSGVRIGKVDRIVSQINDETGTQLTLSAPISNWVGVGDNLTLYAGCDRQHATCRVKFANVENFRGFPHIPGNDFLLRYPRAGTDFDGKPLFK